MFTGIVETTGIVASLADPNRRAPQGPQVRTLSIDADGFFAELAAGASVAVNGVCLTLVQHTPRGAAFDVIVETLARSNLGGLRRGQRVNLEKSLRAGDRIDGHFVQGHVDAVGAVQRIERPAGQWKLWVSVAHRRDADGSHDDGPLAYLIPKGSVALDGVSLTLVDVADGCFSAALIPTTLERTTLGDLRPADTVNIETDIVARTVVHHLRGMGLGAGPAADASLRQRLVESGFIT